jgi:hypothetical protein
MQQLWRPILKAFAYPRGGTTVSVLMKPQGNQHHVTVRVDLVREVDHNGRPIWERCGLVHEYNPLEALRRID